MIFGRNITKRRSRILAVNNLLYFVMFSIIKKGKATNSGEISGGVCWGLASID